jgi:hypothetical protein
VQGFIHLVAKLLFKLSESKIWVFGEVGIFIIVGYIHGAHAALVARLRIPMKPAGYSDLKAATHSDFKAATIPI